MKEGIYDISYEEYSKNSAISNSDLGMALRTLAHYKLHKEMQSKGIEGDSESEAKMLGHLLHELVLEPNKNTLKKIAIRPDDLSFRTKEGKEWRDSNKNKYILTKEQKNILINMRDSIWSHPRAKLFITNGKSEQSIFVKDQETGLNLKGRIDFLPSNDSNLCVDLKTAMDSSKEGFQKAIGRYRYFRQASFYLDLCSKIEGLSPRTVFAIIAVEKTPPFATNIFILEDSAIEAGRLEYKMLLNKVANAIKENKFPACEESEIIAQIPEYYYKRIANED